ncbi:ABC transporter ATP-binding protein, partial [Frisingicoccus sp.]|uniref:ABC transporter ATP-binding protein n=1 Tax=Frisingicoccus sp. TaxID=1918627 RepID=UPI003991A278
MEKKYFYTEAMTVGYQGIPLIRDIQIHISQGEILTLIGPNGAGKSTILKSIAGQLKLLGGAVYLDSRELTKMSGSELAQKMAVVFTERIRSEMMTCEDVVATGRYPYTGKFGILSEADRKVVAEAMELVHMTELRDQDFMKISDGQRQRVMLARAICQEPEIILLDEPTSYLDVKYKLEFMTILQEMTRKKKLSVIMSLHELDLAERISDRILCVHGNYVEKFGPPEEIFVPGYIPHLFDMTVGSFEEGSGLMELEAPQGAPAVFVIAGAGTGRSIFRQLQRKGIPFAVGILYENDLDYPTAKALAVQVLSAEPFEAVSEEQILAARYWIDQCSEVICCRDSFGVWD